MATGDSAPCVFARYMDVIDDDGGWYELTPATGFASFIGGTNPVNQVSVRPWRQPYLQCFTVSKPRLVVATDDDEKDEKKKKNTSQVVEPAVVKNQEDKLNAVKGEEYF